MKPAVAIIGPGCLGQTLGRLLHEAGYPICAVVSRAAGRAKTAARFIGEPKAATTDLHAAFAAELVLLTVPDDALGPLAAALRQQGHVRPGTVLIHFSGLHRASVLLGEEGPAVRALALHPLQTFADAVMGVRNLPGTPVSMEGDDDLMALGEELVEALGGTPFPLAAKNKPLYHAAACIASNYLVTLTSVAGEVMAACGLQDKSALGLLGPLLRGTGRNLAALGPEQALTGPIARGDVRTVAKHLKALEALPQDIQDIYRVMGRQTVALARRRGSLDAEHADALLQLLK